MFSYTDQPVCRLKYTCTDTVKQTMTTVLLNDQVHM